MVLKTEGFACVYWIHTAEQKDEFTQGYIGVSKNPSKRWTQHKTDAKCNRHPNNYLGNAINKYGNNLIYEVIFGGTEQQCFDYELKLRPTPSIGWNLMSGGPVGKITKEGRKKLSEARKNRKPKVLTTRQKWERAVKKSKYLKDLTLIEYKTCVEPYSYHYKTDIDEILFKLDEYRECQIEQERKDNLIKKYGNKKILHKLDGTTFYFKDYPSEYILNDCLQPDSKDIHWQFTK